MRYKNQVVNEFLDKEKITQEEYDILFCNKLNFKKESKRQEEFDNALNKVMELQKDDWILDLSYILFSHFTLKNSNIYENQIISFNDAHFFYKAVFDGINFKNDVNFIGTIFYDMVGFNMTVFSKKAYFLSTIFAQKVSFRGCECKDIFHFTNICFNKIDFIGSYFGNIDLLNLKAFENNSLIALNKTHFENKESARFIKANLEKENNITESNKYFAIEQELYIDELETGNPADTNKYKNLFVLYLNKIVSNFGTDWVRPLLVMFGFGFFATFWYLIFSEKLELFTKVSKYDMYFYSVGGLIYAILLYLTYHYKKWWLLSIFTLGYFFLLFIPEIRSITNDISKLVNPANIFKQKDFFDEIAPYGMFVKLIMATLLYQFIMAFRQNTRRK